MTHISRSGKTGIFILVCIGFLCLMETALAQSVRHPIGPGSYYPADPTELQQAIADLLEKSDAIQPPGRILAIVVPNAPYRWSGSVAAGPMKLLHPGTYQRVVMITPSVQAKFRGFSLPAIGMFGTPLGSVPLDAGAMRRLCWSSLFSMRALKYGPPSFLGDTRVSLHETEHGIEVILPFLQVRLRDFSLIPIVSGELKDHADKLDEKAIEDAATELRKIGDETTLIVISTNLTCYGPEFNFSPRGSMADVVRDLDREALELILSRDFMGFWAYLSRTGNDFPGTIPLMVLMHMLPPNTQSMLIDYDTSMSIDPSRRSSVSYASIVFYDPTKSPLVSQGDGSQPNRPPRERETHESEATETDEVMTHDEPQ